MYDWCRSVDDELDVCVDDIDITWYELIVRHQFVWG